MIWVNGKGYPWENLTIKQLLENMAFAFPLMVVTINNKFVPKEEYDHTIIREGDVVKAMHLISGG